MRSAQTLLLGSHVYRQGNTNMHIHTHIPCIHFKTSHNDYKGYNYHENQKHTDKLIDRLSKT